MKQIDASYGRVAQVLHWISALLLLLLWPLGVLMTRVGDGSTKTLLYQAHVGIGLVVLVLTAARLVWKLVSKYPDPPQGLSRLNQLLFSTIHTLLYVVIVLMVGSGVSMLLLSGMELWPWAVIPVQIADVPPRTLHSVMSRGFLVLLFLHVGGILRYQMSKGDTMARMGVKGVWTRESKTHRMS